MKIYILETYSLDEPVLLSPQHPPKFPRELFCSNSYLSIPLYFSSPEKALEKFKEKYASLDEEDQHTLIYFTISHRGVDEDESYLTQFFNPQGKILATYSEEDVKFSGNDNPAYNLGDWVLYFENGQLQMGKVGALPPSSEEAKKYGTLDQTDNCYFVICVSDNIKDDFPHSHLQEGFILNKINEEELNKYLSFEEIAVINRRYKEHQEYNLKRQANK